MSVQDIDWLKRRLKIAMLESKLFKIRHDYQLLMLLYLGARPSPMSRSALVKKIGCSEVSFRKYYHDLADQGLIEILTSSSDKRKKSVGLTPVGRALLRQYEKAFHQIARP